MAATVLVAGMPVAQVLAHSSVLLRDAPGLRFDTLIDVCGLDYLEYGDGAHQGARFASVVHLLSVECNQRLRVRAFCADDDYPVMPSLTEIWPAGPPKPSRSTART